MTGSYALVGVFKKEIVSSLFQRENLENMRQGKMPQIGDKKTVCHRQNQDLENEGWKDAMAKIT